MLFIGDNIGCALSGKILLYLLPLQYLNNVLKNYNLTNENVYGINQPFVELLIMIISLFMLLLIT